MQFSFDNNNKNNILFLSNSTLLATNNSVERDENGRPIRKGFVPVEEKILSELRDLKNRETELKMRRKLTLHISRPNNLDNDER